jgi:uncharacterized hydrophobic protein (TIGR00271 family)
MTFIQRVFDIRSSSEPQRAINSIAENVSIRGYNIWLLFCSTVLACIGLDTSSSAVIIGAMLISPLMSPILGIGLSLGIYDRQLLFRSMRDFGAAVVLSLVTAVLYFLISPFAFPTPEMEARTYPTLLDVLIAFFGGVAGIVSASRSGLANAIPGVAIATALMPPLCTAGYGIATQRWEYFGGAFYLFFINAVFITLATYLIVKYLHFPVKTFATRRQKNFYFLVFSTLVVIVTAPSIYFLYSVYEKQTLNTKLDTYVINPIRQQGNEILKWELADKDSVVWIKVYHSGNALSDSLKNQIDRSLSINGLRHYELKPIRVNMTKEEVNALTADVSRQMFQQLQLEQIATEKEKDKADTLSYYQLTKEVKVAFPFVDTLYNGWFTIRDSSSKIDTIPAAFFRSTSGISQPQRQQLYQFLRLRFGKDTLLLIQQ